MTSNLGSSYLLEGIGEDGQISKTAADLVENELKVHLRPEILNRLDEIIMFKPLTRDNIDRIIDLQMVEVNKRLAEQELRVELDDEARSKAIEEGFDPAFGARPLKRYLQRYVETLAARLILKGDIHEGDTIRIGVKDDALYAYV